MLEELNTPEVQDIDAGEQGTPNDDVDILAEVEPEQEKKELSDIEKKAREYGWHPADDFSGDTSKYISAEEFVRRTEEEVPIIKAQAKKDRKKAKDLEELTGALQSHLERAREREKAAEERGYKRAKDEIERKMAEAVEYGDVDTFNQLRKQEKELEQEKQEVMQHYAESTPQQPALDPAIEEWGRNNQDIVSDPTLFYQMTEKMKYLNSNYAYMGIEERLKIAESEVKQNNPAKFKEKEKTPMTQSVEGNNRQGSTLTLKGKKSYTINDLKPADRAVLKKHAGVGGLYDTKEKQLKFIKTIVDSYGDN